MTFSNRYQLLIVLFLLSSCSQAEIPGSWILPKKLNEISGLAQGFGGRIFAINDERAVIYEFDLQSGDVRGIVKIIGLDGKVVKSDIEGIAVLDEHFYLLNSTGRLYKAKPDGFESITRVESRYLDTGLSNVCEFEGLSSFKGMLFLACKKNYLKKDKGFLLIYKFDPKSELITEYLRVDVQDLNRKKIHPSGLAVTESQILLVAARQHLLIRLDKKGNFIGDMKLDKKAHRQTEGIVVLNSSQLILADEGKRKGGKITIYPLNTIP
ncbi:MAG: hypothetical protein ACI9CE_001473 [Flavobacterium sp.]|jgi:uncharacterized protein YjiK